MHLGFIARKYLFSRVIAFAALVVVASSVALLIVIVSVMEGFRSELQGRIRSTSSDLKVEGTRYIGLREPEAVAEIVSRVAGVRSAEPYVETLVLFRNEGVLGGEELEHRFLRVVDVDRELRERELAEWIRAGRNPEIPIPSPEDPRDLFRPEWLKLVRRLRRAAAEKPAEKPLEVPPAILVGAEAFRRYVLPGDTVQLTAFSPSTQTPRTGEFTVAGYFKTGIYELDSLGLILDRAAARGFLGLVLPDGRETASGLRIEVEPGRSSEEGLREVQEAVRAALDQAGVPFVRVLTWRDEKSSLLDAVRTEKFLMSFILGVIILFSGLMMFIILTLLVVEKTRDLGVLQSLGVTPRGIQAIFVRIGAALCLGGTAIGVAYGLGFAFGVNTIQRWITLLTGLEVFPRNVYYLDRIPVRFEVLDLALIIAPTVLVSFLGAQIPALRAARKDPVVALRYE
ncbi:MAG: ABC transporter permease [Planctomycetes bacterium]|nr:ABC transporter permease [Planctomycetota bacterium]